ncbi:MAG: M20/M25/M40 family metallo-hydrolase [Alicyclobacillus sp.]|nr:M20/M25/M40 family metallo-hydrolase [Alicyclobacillus sp.]
MEHQPVREALAFLQADNDQTTQDQVMLTEIPAPPFHEDERGARYQEMLEELGLNNPRVDDEGNVLSEWLGTEEDGPAVFVGGHLDTVFPPETDVTVHVRDGVYFAPGIADNGRGLAATLSLARAFRHAQLRTVGTVVFGATVGEEGLGDLRGVKALFRNQAGNVASDFADGATGLSVDGSEAPAAGLTLRESEAGIARPVLDGFISIEPGEASRATYLGTGSHRYRVIFRGPGGHSFGAFGIPSAIHALGRAIAKIADIEVPSEPRTTFTVGEIRGGTSVNTIAAEATMMVDMRSNSEEALLELERQVLAAIRAAVVEENERWDSKAMEVEIALVGDRPAGSQPDDAVIVQTAVEAAKALGFAPVLEEAKSTDANVPISLGVPALTLGGGGDAGGMHTLGEWFNPNGAYTGVQKILLTLLALVGVEGVSDPLLPKRASARL